MNENIADAQAQDILAGATPGNWSNHRLSSPPSPATEVRAIQYLGPGRTSMPVVAECAREEDAAAIVAGHKALGQLAGTQEEISRLRTILEAVTSLCQNTDGEWLHEDAEVPVSEFIGALHGYDIAP